MPKGDASLSLLFGKLDDPRSFQPEPPTSIDEYHRRAERVDLVEHAHELTKLAPFATWAEIGTMARLQGPAVQDVLHRHDRAYPLARVLPLPPPLPLDAPLGDLLRTRKSARAYAVAPVSSAALATVLFAAAGQISAVRRTIPSGGALQPTRVFALALASGEVPAGIYHYDSPRHQLEALRALEPAIVTRMLSAILVDPEMRDLGGAGLLLVMTARFWRSRVKYGARGYRYAHLEAGAAAQNVSLAATALGLGHVLIGGFYDNELHAWLEIDGVDHAALVAVAIGVRA